MCTIRIRLVSPLLLAVALSLSVAGTTFAEGNAHATGGGTFTEDGERSTFTFNAIQLPDGTVAGHFVYVYRAADILLRATVDCLDIRGNVAVIGGRTSQEVVVGGTWVIPEGTQIVFAVEDNGEGGDAAPDRVSNVRVDTSYEGPTCRETVDRLPLWPIDGNVQVAA